MTFEDFIDEFVDIFDDTEREELTPETNFRDLEEWSSLHGLATMNMLEQVYGKKLSVAEFKAQNTVQDLFNIASA